jgi:integrase
MASISQRGDKWRAKVRKAGAAPQSKTFDTYEEAEQWAKDLEEHIESGKPLEREAADLTPVRDLVQLYWDVVGPTPDNEAELVALKLAPFADLMASELTAEDITAWQPERTKLMDVLEEVIEKARTDFGINLPDNPVRAAYAQPQTTRVRRLASYEESQLLAEAGRTRGGYLTDAIILALETALKQSELVNLDWSEVHMDRGEIVARSNSGDRIIPLSDKAKSVLASRGTQLKGQVFSGLSTKALQRSFIRAVDRANILDLHFNDLRHEAIFRMKSLYPFEEVLRISGVGHRSLERYYGSHGA